MERHQRAFSLIEVVLALVITAMVLAVFISFFSSLMTGLARPVITRDGISYSLAPIIRDDSDGVAKTGLLDAFDFHDEFTRQLKSADTIAVFGAAANPSNYPSVPAVVSLSYAPLQIGASSPKQLGSPAQVYGQLSLPVAETTGIYINDRCFDVLMVTGLRDITCIVNVRVRNADRSGGITTPLTYEGRPAVLYLTQMRTRNVGDTTWTTRTYAFWLPAEEDIWTVNVGATHLWLRQDQASSWWQRSEMAGYTLVFPDPYMLAAIAAEDDGSVRPNYSRFTYFVPFSPIQ